MKRFLPFILSLTVYGCVEHLIFVRVLPSGDAEITITSRGDSTDIRDDDFLHPQLSPWHQEVHREKKDDEIVLVQVSTAILQSDTIPLPGRTGPGIQTYSIRMQKNRGWFVTTYRFRERFKGRELYIKSPRLATAIGNNEAADSTQWETEALNYIFHSAIDDLDQDSALVLPYGMPDRIKTHFTNYLAHVEALKVYEELSQQPDVMLRKILSPFLPDLPDEYIPRFRDAMQPYEQDIATSYHLNDDQFTVAVILPGQVYSTNADTIAGDTLKWSFSVEAFINDDLILDATSMVISPASFQRTVVFATLILVIVFFMGWKLKK
ncbi:MAG: hypothetical protein ACE5D8_04820 [Fidelibacterota bacterium]